MNLTPNQIGTPCICGGKASAPSEQELPDGCITCNGYALANGRGEIICL